MEVTIVGAGKMGRAVGSRVIAGGHDLVLIDNDPDDAKQAVEDLEQSGAQGGVRTGSPDDAIDSDVVVLAVYYPALQPAVEQYGDRLAGKVVVDVSNPIDFDTFDGLAVDPGTSAAEEVAQAVPDARVVKAFNTTFGNTLLEGQVAGQPLDVLIAGDDDDAKSKVIQLAEDGGLTGIDVGPLRRARELESLGFLHISLQDRLGTGFKSTMKLLS